MWFPLTFATISGFQGASTLDAGLEYVRVKSFDHFDESPLSESGDRLANGA